jgi:hypothetical protein
MNDGAVSLHALAGLWNDFMFQPQSAATMVIFRIAFSLLLLVDAIFHAKGMMLFLGPQGVLNFVAWRREFSPRVFSIFTYTSGGMTAVRLVFAAHFFCIFFVLLGWHTQFFVVMVFITLTSIQHRNPVILNSGDVAMRLMLFLFMFESNADSMLSINATAGAFKNAVLEEPWCRRLMQILVANIYFKSMYWKLMGSMWREGSAVFYVLNIKRYQRLRFPDFAKRPFVFQMLAWSTLVIWGALGTLIWIDEFRYPLIVIGVLFHIAMDMFLKIRLFQWVMMTGLILFIKPSDAEWAIEALFALM